MIHISRDNRVFNYRAVGISIVDGRVLLSRYAHDDFWTLPGGVCDLSEDTRTTLLREMKEKIDAEVEVERIVYIVENFFDYAGKSYQEVAFYYAMTLPPGTAALTATAPMEADDADGKVILEWHDVTKLGEITLYPPFLREGLKRPPASPIHLVVRE